MELFALWTKILDTIKAQDPQYHTVFMENVFPMAFHDNELSIMVSTEKQPWIAGWIKAVYKDKLTSIASQAAGAPVNLKIHLSGETEEPEHTEPAPAPSRPAPKTQEKKPEPAEAPTTIFPETVKPAMPVPDFIQQVAQGNYTHSKLPNIHDKLKKQNMEPSNLFENVNVSNTDSENFEDQISINREFTFDTFIHGPSNELAFQAAKSVAEAAVSGQMDTRTNPLFIYGPSGLGKTHLLHAICNYIHEKAPSLNVRFITSETFLNDLIKSIETSTMDKFRRRYRFVDYFLMDDVQLFSGKNSSQTEIFNTFNVLFDNNKHIILTSDRTPQDIEKLEDRIKTRFSSGLIAPIEPPDYEMCSVILSKKAEADHIVLPEEIINYIAGHIHTNIRELNGAYNKLVSYCQFTGKHMDLETAKTALRDVIPLDQAEKMTMDTITDVVCEYYGVSKASVLSSGRPKKIVIPRQMAMYFCRSMLNESFASIRDFFKRKDHSTVVYACRRVENELKTKPDVKADYDKLKNILNKRW
jgi:chromosomal replication initiator protein